MEETILDIREDDDFWYFSCEDIKEILEHISE